MKIYLRLLAIVILCLGLVACGAQGPGGTPATSDSTTPAPDATESDPAESDDVEDPFAENPYWDADLCSLISLDAVAEAAGGLEPMESEPSDSPPASCRYVVGLPVGTFPSTAAIDVQMLSGFELERIGAGDAAQDVAGIGDEAWEHALTDTLVLYVSRGDLVFWVAAAGGGDWTAMTRSVAELVLATL